MALIELKEVTKIYRVGDQEIRALDGVSLSIEAGDYMAIIGPSGSGKSTLMHLLGCLDIPTTGTVRLDGADISHAGGDQLAEVRNSMIGFVFQSFNLLPRLTVVENVEMPLVYGGVSAAARRSQALEAIASVGLSDRVNNKPAQLSGGQCQRVAIARALVNRPKIILADEPTGALDSKTGQTILQLFRELSQQGNTIAIVTHDQKIAMEPPRRIEIQDGKILSDTRR